MFKAMFCLSHNFFCAKFRRKIQLHCQWVFTMSGQTHLSTLIQQGITSPIQLHRATGVPLRTIHYNLKKWHQTGTTQHRPRSGRPQKFQANDHRRVGMLLRHYPELTSDELAQKTRELGSPSITARTMRRVLVRMERQYQLPVNRPILLERHKTARLEFARAHLDDDWSSTVFSDEASFQLYRNTIKVWTRSGSHSVKKKTTQAWAQNSCLGSLFCTGPSWLLYVLRKFNSRPIHWHLRSSLPTTSHESIWWWLEVSTG